MNFRIIDWSRDTHGFSLLIKAMVHKHKTTEWVCCCIQLVPLRSAYVTIIVFFIYTFQIHLKRKSLYYDYIVIAPTIMLCVLTLASFLLPCHKGEKIAIGLTVFLTLYVLQLRIADNVPDTNTTPILSKYILKNVTCAHDYIHATFTKWHLKTKIMVF